MKIEMILMNIFGFIWIGVASWRYGGGHDIIGTINIAIANIWFVGAIVLATINDKLESD